MKKDGTKQILIYHTHTTEAFAGSSRTQDNSQNVVAVGEEIKKQLEAAGFGVVHDTTCHDYPSYNGSYDRSGETIQRNLEKYPDIQVTFCLLYTSKSWSFCFFRASSASSSFFCIASFSALAFFPPKPP